MPKDILPELRLADVAELAPTSSVQPEGFSLNFTSQESNAFLDVPNQPDAGAQMMGSAAQENGPVQTTGGGFGELNAAQIQKMAQAPFHTLRNENSFSPGNSTGEVTDGTSFSPTTPQNPFPESSPHSIGGNSTGTAQTDLFQSPLSDRISSQVSPAENMCGNANLEGQEILSSPSARVNSSQFPGKEGHQICQELTTGSPQQVDVNAHQQLQINKQQIGMNAEDLSSQQQRNSQQQMGLTTQQQIQSTIQNHHNINTQQQMDVNCPLQMDANSPQQMDANPQQQVNIRNQLQMNISNQYQMNVGHQQQTNTNLQQQINVTPELQMNTSNQLQMNTNIQQQMDANPQLQMNTSNQLQMNTNAQQQMNMNTQPQMNISPQLQMNSSTQQQIDANSLLQLNANPEKQMNVSPQLQMNMNPAHQIDVNTPLQMNTIPAQQMDVNPQLQLNVPTQQQIVISTQQQVAQNNQQIGMNTQQPVHLILRDQLTPQHLQQILNTQIEEGMKQQLRNPQQQTDMDPQNQADINPQQQNNFNSQQQTDFNAQQQTNFNSQQQTNFNPQQQTNFNSQQQTDFNPQQQNNFNSQQQTNFNSQQQTDFNPQQQTNFNSQQQTNFNPQHQTNFNPQQQTNFNSQQQTNFNSQQQTNFNPQQQTNFNPQQQTNFNPQQQTNFNPQQQMNFNTQQQTNFNPQQQTNFNPQQQTNFNPQQQTNFNPQHQRDMNPQQQNDMSPQQQMNGSPQEHLKAENIVEANTEQQLNITAQHQSEGNHHQQMNSQSTQNEMAVKTERSNIDQQIQAHIQQQIDRNSPSHISVNPVQVGMDTQQQEGMAMNHQMNINAEHQMVKNPQHHLNIITQQVKDNLQQQMNVNHEEHGVGGGQQKMDVTPSLQIANVKTQSQVVTNSQQQTDVQRINSPEELCGNSQQIVMETHARELSSQQQIVGSNQQVAMDTQQHLGIGIQQQMTNLQQQIGLSSPQEIAVNLSQQVTANSQQQMSMNAQQMMINTQQPHIDGPQQQFTQNEQHLNSTPQMSMQTNVNTPHQMNTSTQPMSTSSMETNTNTQQQMNSTQQLLQDQQHGNLNSYHFSESNNLNCSMQQELNGNTLQMSVNRQNLNVNINSAPGNIQDMNNAVQHFNQTQRTVIEHNDSKINQPLMIDTCLAQITSPVDSPSNNNLLNTVSPGRMESTLQHSQNVFSITQHNPETRGNQREIQAGLVFTSAANEDVPNKANQSPSNIYDVVSNASTVVFSTSGITVPSGQQSVCRTSSLIDSQNAPAGHGGFMTGHIEQNIQTGNPTVNISGQLMISNSSHSATTDTFGPGKVSSPSNQLQALGAGSFLDNSQACAAPPVRPQRTLHSEETEEGGIRMFPSEGLTFSPSPLETPVSPVLEEQFHCNPVSTLVKEPSDFHFGSNQREFVQLKSHDLDSNTSSQHVSRSASGQTSPCNLGSPHNFDCEEENAQSSPIQTNPATTLAQSDLDSAALFSGLLRHCISTAGADSTSTSVPSVQSTHQTMDQDTSSQASLVAMSEKLKLMDSNSTTFPISFLTGTDFDGILTDEETRFVDLPHEGQNLLNTPAPVSEMSSSTPSSASFSFVRHLVTGLTSFSTETTSTSTVDSLTSESSSTRSPKIAEESDSRMFLKPNEPVRYKPSRDRRVKKMREASLCQQFPASAKGYQLKIVKQPENHHRARYKTEGSRGSVKDRSQEGYPTVKLTGIHQTVTLQVFVGNDSGKVKPHGFYQACKVCGKNSTPCVERDVDGTTVIELQLDPSTNMEAKIDCVGILKLRNADVEQRMGVSKAKKKSLKARLVFRVTFKGSDNNSHTLQVSSDPILCTQPIGAPEVCKKSLSEAPVEGGCELFIIGKNFMKGTKVLFQEYADSGEVVWEGEGEIDTDFFQNTHLICTVPAYKNSQILNPVDVRLVVQCSGKASYPQGFSYIPKVKQESMETESCLQKSFLHKVAPAALQLNGMISNSANGMFQLPEEVTRTLLSEKRAMKMETNQDFPQPCSNIVLTSPSQALVSPDTSGIGTSIVLSAAPSWSSTGQPVLLTMANINMIQSGINMSNNQCVQPTQPSIIVVPQVGVSNPQTIVSGQVENILQPVCIKGVPVTKPL